MVIAEFKGYFLRQQGGVDDRALSSNKKVNVSERVGLGPGTMVRVV